jgi:hypothetical protein
MPEAPAGNRERSLSLPIAVLSMEGPGVMRGSWLRKPVLAHELVRPRRLANLLPRQKLGHDGLDVKHGRSIERIKFRDEKPGAFDPNHATDGAPDAIRAVLAALRKDADRRPVLIVSWMTRPGDCIGPSCLDTG